MIWSMINICLKFLYMIQHEHWQYADNITLVWNIVIHIWSAWIVFDNMQRAEASELIRLMASSRAVCSREEHGTDKCQNISPILSTYWHCSLFKNNLAVLALDRNRELKSHNIILLFFERFDQCMEVSERAIILSSLYN